MTPSLNNEISSGLVVGAGSIGKRHANNMSELGIEVSVVDEDEVSRNKLEDKVQGRAYDSLTDALSSRLFDIAIICTPNSYHIEHATEAAKAGCHLFIEKPLSHGLEGVADLEAIIEDRGLVSLVGCNLRFHPEIKKIRELLQNGVIGTVVAARIEGGSYLPKWFPDSDYEDSYSARPDLGGGVILDYIHEINYARWLFGEFQMVTAMAGQKTHLNVETNDIAAITAETSSGILCEFHLDYVQRSYSRSCHIIGEEGTIRWNWQDKCVEWITAGEENWNAYDRPNEWAMNDMYMREMEHFLGCVRQERDATCPVQCGRRDLEIALAARESAKTGHHVSVGGECIR